MKIGPIYGLRGECEAKKLGSKNLEIEHSTSKALASNLNKKSNFDTCVFYLTISSEAD